MLAFLGLNKNKTLCDESYCERLKRKSQTSYLIADSWEVDKIEAHLDKCSTCVENIGEPNTKAEEIAIVTRRNLEEVYNHKLRTSKNWFEL